MKYFKRVRWVSFSAVLTALFLLSSHANAVMITMENLTPTGGTLVLDFDGDPLGGLSDNLLEGAELSSFSAVYTAATDPMQINWDPELPSLFLIFSYNVTTGIVESLLYDNFDPDAEFPAEFFIVEVNSGLGGTIHGHYAEVTPLFGIEPLAYTDEIPSPEGEVPSPGTLLLFALGLLAMAWWQLSSSRVRQSL